MVWAVGTSNCLSSFSNFRSSTLHREHIRDRHKPMDNSSVRDCVMPNALRIFYYRTLNWMVKCLDGLHNPEANTL